MDTLHVHIRAMTDDDRGMVFILAEEQLRPLAAAAGHPERFNDEEFLDLIGRGEVYVAESPREPAVIAGYVVVENEPADALTVRCVCVGPAFEGQRVGHRLLDWAEGLAYSRGLSRLAAPLPGDDQRSRHLYGEHDYVPVPAADDRPELIVMEKRLR
jgi:GNAT superfamily N-acetyltransferase